MLSLASPPTLLQSETSSIHARNITSPHALALNSVASGTSPSTALYFSGDGPMLPGGGYAQPPLPMSGPPMQIRGPDMVNGFAGRASPSGAYRAPNGASEAMAKGVPNAMGLPNGAPNGMPNGGGYSEPPAHGGYLANGGGTSPNAESGRGPPGQNTAGSPSNGPTSVVNGSAGRSRRARPDAEEIKRVARIHYQELFGFLRSHLAKNQLGPRSNAREKLTRLSKQQFTELSTDVYDELLRRINNARFGQDLPHLPVRDEFHPKRNQARQKLATLPKTRFKDLASDVFFELERRFPELREEFRPDAPEAQTVSGSQFGASPPLPRAAPMIPQPSTSEVVIPSKSTLVEEQINVPYTAPDRAQPNGSSRGEARRTSAGAASVASLNSTQRDDNLTNDHRNTMMSQTSSVGTGFLNGYAASRTGESVASPNLRSSSGGEPGPTTFGIEKLRSDYEFRIATLQQRVTNLESQKAEADAELASSRALSASNDRKVEAMRTEIEQLRKTHDVELSAIRRDKESHQERHERAAADLRETKSSLERLRADHDKLQRDQALREEHAGATSALREQLAALQHEYSQQEGLVQELKGEVASLLEQMRQMSDRIDSMLADKDSDVTIIRDLNQQVQMFKRKYESAKTELRNLKGSSQLFVHPPKPNLGDTAADTGAIADVHLTAFQSSIDDLLAAARSRTPSNVLLALKTVILATSLITDDVSKFEASPSWELSGEERERLGLLKTKSSLALNNLMTACRNHASSQGLTPVSLLDAAASHVATSTVDLTKLLKVRKANKNEAEDFESSFSHGTLTNGLKPLHINAVSGARDAPQPFSPTTSAPPTSASMEGSFDRLNPATTTEGRFSPRNRHGPTMGRYSPVGYRARSDLSRKNSSGESVYKSELQRAASVSSASSSIPAPVPAIPDVNTALRAAGRGVDSERQDFAASPSADTERVHSVSLGARTGAQREEDWAELRVYIEKQTELIVHSIQSLLSAIREGRSTQELNEHLTSITTIVASIVAISKGNLPSTSQAEGEKVLAELTSNTDKLSDISQNQSSFDKKEKSLIASASYGIAKGLKRLTELLVPGNDDGR